MTEISVSLRSDVDNHGTLGVGRSECQVPAIPPIGFIHKIQDAAVF